MKKLELNWPRFTGATLLSREELKKVMGGNEHPSCYCLQWTCTTATHSIFLGAATCLEALNQCSSPFADLTGEGCE